MNAIGERLYERQFGRSLIVSRDVIPSFVADAAAAVSGHKFSQGFLLGEWEELVDAWQLDSWELYRDVKRLGRKIRLPEAQRVVLWSLFE